MPFWQVLAHVKQKLHLEERRRAELEATLAVAQEKLRERKERGRLLKRQREKRRLRKIKMQEAELFEDPTLLAHFQVTAPFKSCILTVGDRVHHWKIIGTANSITFCEQGPNVVTACFGAGALSSSRAVDI